MRNVTSKKQNRKIQTNCDSLNRYYTRSEKTIKAQVYFNIKYTKLNGNGDV